MQRWELRQDLIPNAGNTLHSDLAAVGLLASPLCHRAIHPRHLHVHRTACRRLSATVKGKENPIGPLMQPHPWWRTTYLSRFEGWSLPMTAALLSHRLSRPRHLFHRR